MTVSQTKIIGPGTPGYVENNYNSWMNRVSRGPNAIDKKSIEHQTKISEDGQFVTIFVFYNASSN